MAAPPAGDHTKVAKKILEWHWKNVAHAKDVTRAILEQAEHDFEVYSPQPSVSKSQAEEQETDVNTPECANQSDVVRAEYHRAFFEGSEGGFRGVAEPQEDQHKVDASIAVIRDMLHQHGCEDQLDDSLFDFLNQPYGGLEVVRRYREHEIIEVPADDVLVQEQVAAFEEIGKPHRIIRMDDEVVVFEAGYVDFAYEAIDGRQFFVSGRMTKNIHDVPSIHRVNIWNMDQLEDSDLRYHELGAGDANGRISVEGTPAARRSEQGGVTETNPNFEQWEIWRSDSSIPWKSWLKAGDFTEDDLMAFVTEYGIDPSEIGKRQKWRVFHNQDKVLLGIEPNFLPGRWKNCYAYEIDSFIKRRRELFSASYLSRIAEWEAINHALTAMLMDNIKVKVYMSALIDDLGSMDETKFQELFKRKGLVKVEKGSKEWDSMIKFFGEMVPDMTTGTMAGINLAKGNLQTYGSPAILMGQGDSETATQDMVNAQKGGQKITAPLRRYIHSVFLPTMEKIRDCVHHYFDGARWIRQQGERGAPIARDPKPVTGADITNRYRIIPTATFDFVDRPVKAQQLTAILNIAAPILTGAIPPTPAFFRLLGAVMEYHGIPREIIDAVTDNEGRGTDPEDEIRVLELNPSARVHVRAEDDHALCLMLLNQRTEELNAEMPGKGDAFMAQDNVKRYFRDHMYQLQLQEMQQAMMEQQQEQEGDGEGKGGPKGPPAQPNPNPPTSAIGITRQSAQLSSPPDKTDSPGMTGQGSMNAIAGGKTQQLLTVGGAAVR